MRSPRVILSLLFSLFFLSVPTVSHALKVTVTGCSPLSGSIGSTVGMGGVTATSGSTTLTFSSTQSFTTPQCIRTAGGNVYLITSGSGTSWTISQPAVAGEMGVTFTVLTTFRATRSALPGVTDPTTGLPFIDLSTVPLTTPDFTITYLLCFAGPARVFLDSSGGVNRILLDNVMIIVDPTVQCAPGSSPCAPLQIQATSEVPPAVSTADFPALPAGGYPGGVKMSGTFFGLITNDTASATGLGNGDVINVTSPGPADTQTSLPGSCSGTPTCVFTAGATSSSVPSIDTFLSETVQLVCPGTATMCPPSLGFTLNINANAGDSFDPKLGGTAGSQKPDSNNLKAFLASFAAFSPTVNVTNVANGSVTLSAPFTLDMKSSFAFPNMIDATTNEIGVAVGPLDTTIPAGSFHTTPNGCFEFQGPRDTVFLEARLCPLGGNKYRFTAQLQGPPLIGIGIQNPVRVELRIDTSDFGRKDVQASSLN